MIPDTLSSTIANDSDDSCCGHDDHHHAEFDLGWAVFGGILILNSFLARYIYAHEPIAETVSAILGALILIYPILRTAVKDVLQGKVYMNELVALAVLAAFVMEKYQEAGIIAFFMLIAITIEEKTAIGAKDAIEDIIKLTPKTARRVSDDTETEISASDLKIGDIIRVRPGENFPADGVVVSGSSAVNQASITGESLPADKEVDSKIFAGTTNLTSMVDVRVTSIGSDSTLGKVRSLIEEAERTRLPIMRMVDQYVVYYTPTILMIAALVWFFTHDLMRVVLVLVISCPCALVIATPSAVVAAIAAAARLGMLIKNVAHIEMASQINAVVFDKTGTLTEGNLEVARLNPGEGIELSDLLEVAVSAESQSNHPAADAMRRLAEDAKVKWQTPDEFTEVAGKGVVAKFGDSTYRVGREIWFAEQGLDVKPFGDSFRSDEFVGMSVIYVARDEQVLGWIGLRDAIRQEARETIEQLHALGVNTCCMVTGDNESVANVVAKKIGITEISADCLPGEKVDYVNDLKRRGMAVAVVGDGVNDAPALAAGSIGIAMGAIGSDVAVNSASIALMNNDLRRIPFLIELSRKTRAVMNLNLAFGAILIAGGLMFFIFGDDSINQLAANGPFEASVVKAFLAAIVHIVGTLLIVFNSARLIRFGESLDSE
jgi:Cd2+/Zn2+-exporting ATPase